jgi:DNA gyrase subunit A
VGGNTKCAVAFFSNFGSCYTIRINDIPPSRGYGDPIQRFFKFRDGEKVVGAVSFDPRCLTHIGSSADKEDVVPRNHAFAVSSAGYGIRFALHPFLEASTRSGRKYAKLREGEEVLRAFVVTGEETVILATREGRVILFVASEVNFLSGAGRGVLAIKLDKSDRVIGAAVVPADAREGLRVITAGGREIHVSPRTYRVASRAGKGVQVIKRGGLSGVARAEIALPDFGESDGPAGANGEGRTNGASNGSSRGSSRRRSNGAEAEDNEA